MFESKTLLLKNAVDVKFGYMDIDDDVCDVDTDGSVKYQYSRWFHHQQTDQVKK